MRELIHKAFTHIIEEHPEHFFFYLISSIVMIILLIKNDPEIRRGLRGNNDLLEAPESIIYLFIWLTPQVVLAVLFLMLTPPDWLWIFMMTCLMFALAGRDGIQMLFNWRGGVVKNENKEENK